MVLDFKISPFGRNDRKRAQAGLLHSLENQNPVLSTPPDPRLNRGGRVDQGGFL